MVIACPHCQHSLDFTGEPPAFCAYCGKPLRRSEPAVATAPSEGTAEFLDPQQTVTRGDAGQNTASEVPHSVGGYRLLRELGAGGMGTVYEAEEGATGRRVAVKLLGRRESSRSAFDRFRQEGQLASRITHPRCVFVLTADEEAGRPYIVMELMPGDTLKDLVAEHGPLPVPDAVAKTLDVIDGLQEAHRLGILHRDVKPSNCFLAPDGRVKVGDFGLSKSLERKTDLTGSGAFLGTVLYAAPEQLRGEPADYRVDVYAVCATIYYLLTGQAPFQHENPAVVIGKVMSEPVPSPRRLRPQVPRKLERVVLRGLERSRERRWQTLGELRDALSELVPSRMTRGGLGVRFAAYLIDLAILVGVGIPIVASAPLDEAAVDLVSALGEIAYFAACESLFGCSVGKYCLRLRVAGGDGNVPPPWPRVLIRSATFVFLTGLWELTAYLGREDPGLLVQWSFWGLQLGLFLLVVTMRERNGYQGFHEWLSGTRTLRLPWPKRNRALRSLTAGRPPAPLPAGRYPEAFGAFRPTGVLVDDADRPVLVGEESALSRAVHIVLSPAGVDEARRQLNRPTRARWLGGGQSGAWHWDAFLAPSGWPLADVVTPQMPLSWSDTRNLLEQLAEELAAGLADGSLPAALTVEQVWVLPTGRLELIDFPLAARDQTRSVPDEAACLRLLRDVAVLALEGRPRPESAEPTPIRALVPPHASAILDHLVGVRSLRENDARPPQDGRRVFLGRTVRVRARTEGLADFRTALTETHENPAETTAPMRAGHLGLQALFMALGVVAMFLFAGLAGNLDLLYLASAIHGEERFLEGTNSGQPPEFLKALPGERQQEVRAAVDRQLAQDRERLQQRLGQANYVERFLHRNYAHRLPDTGHAGVSDPRVIVRRATGHWPPGAEPAVGFPRFGSAQTLKDRYPDIAWFLLGSLALFPAVWVASAFLTRGGLTLQLVGLALVRGDGRKAARWRCAWRALLVWAPVVALLFGCVTVKLLAPQHFLLSAACWWAAALFLGGGALLAVRSPQQSIHDRLAGVFVVPQ
jgi:hypothetical protein